MAKRATFPCPVCKGKYHLEGDGWNEPQINCSWCDYGQMIIGSDTHKDYAFSIWMEKAPFFLWHEDEDTSFREVLRRGIKWITKLERK